LVQKLIGIVHKHQDSNLNFWAFCSLLIRVLGLNFKTLVSDLRAVKTPAFKNWEKFK